MRFVDTLLRFSTLITLSLLLFVSAAFGAKVDSIDGSVVSLFLETLDDEDVEEGQTVYLVNSSGKKVVTLKVQKNRGTYADAKVISGSPSKSLKVLMPHETAKKAVSKKTVTPAKTVPKSLPKPKKGVGKKSSPRKSKLPRATTRAPITGKPKTPRKTAPARLKQSSEARTKPNELTLPKDNDRPKNTLSGTDSLSLGDGSLQEDYNSEGSAQAQSSQEEPLKKYKWVVSTDLLTLAGIVYNFQIFSIMFERAVLPSLSVGLRGNFLSYIGGPSLSTDRLEPLVRRTEFGLFSRYHFGKNVTDSGVFIFASGKWANEQWSSAVDTQNNERFTSASAGGFVLAGGFGYQYGYRNLLVRLGYHLQFSNFENPAVFEDVSYERGLSIASGFGHYGLLQVGLRF